MVVGGQGHPSCALLLAKRPGSHFTRGCVGPTADLEDSKNLTPPAFDPGPSIRHQTNLYAGAYHLYFIIKTNPGFLMVAVF